MKSTGKMAITAVLFMSVALISVAQAQTRIDLSGTWSVRLDPDRTFDPAAPGAEAAKSDSLPMAKLPGALRDNGLGDKVGPDTKWILDNKYLMGEKYPEYKKFLDPENFKEPCRLQPERHYVGTAFYSRAVDIPESWKDQRVVLTLERPHWYTRVWVDGKPAGKGESLATPHVFDLTNWMTPGRHELVIGIDNSLDEVNIGVNSHSVTDHTQGAWHGMVGRIELQATPKVAIESAQVFPDEDTKTVQAALQLVNLSGRPCDGRLTLSVSQAGQVLGRKTFPITAAEGSTTHQFTLPLDRPAKRWDEFEPNLCRFEATLQSDKNAVTIKQVDFGVRHIKTNGTRFVLNDRPLMLRGTLECCIFPLTGYPPTDVDAWKRIIRICKEHGLNHIRFHSWCPPEAAFTAADELGFYYQVECSSWPNQGTTVGEGYPRDQWLYREGQRILDAYGNHPSFLLLAMGNEPSGPKRKKNFPESWEKESKKGDRNWWPAWAKQGGLYLMDWVDHFKAKTDRQLVTGGSGWPEIPENEYHVTPQPRIYLAWRRPEPPNRLISRPPATMADYRDVVAQWNVPTIGHEIGQWCVFPNFDEMKKYTGTLKPRNFEIFGELLDDVHLLDQAHDFFMASGKLQSICYKEEVESSLRTPGLGGFELLDLHDFPGQGTALVGILDPFWDSKPYISAAEFRRFCGPTIPLARLPKRSWTNDETFTAEIELSHFGPKTLTDATPRWSLRRDGKIIRSGVLPSADVAVGTLAKLGKVAIPLADIKAPAKLSFEVSLEDGSQKHANDWDIWVYPTQVDTSVPDDILLTSTLDEKAEAHLKQGGKVVLMADPRQVDCKVKMAFTPIYWSTAHFLSGLSEVLGILCDPNHPALAAFPTDYHSNWQWWDLITHARPMQLDRLPPELRPTVQVVPDWFHPKRLGLLFEAKIGKGKLLVCSIDLTSDLANRPVARQLQHSLLQYVESDKFAPTVSLDANAVRGLFRKPKEKK